ncbi:MAG: hypothetical protein RLP09_45640 [Sandaracinaceae bacterium]
MSPRRALLPIACLPLAFAVMASACAGTPASRPREEPTQSSADVRDVEFEGAQRDRAQAVLADLESWCGEHEDACGASARPDIYPDVEVSEVDRRYVDDRKQRLRTLGVQVRWDPGTRRFEVVRGNTPIFDGNEDP